MSRVSSSLATLGVALCPLLAFALIALGLGEYEMDYMNLAINVALMFGSAVLGVVFGTMHQNYLNRIAEEAARRKLREQLREAVQFNVDRMNDIESHLKGNEAGQVSSPDFLLDTALINHVLFSGRDLFTSKDEYKTLNWHRYQLEHINNKLRLLSEPPLFTYYLFHPDGGPGLVDGYLSYTDRQEARARIERARDLARDAWYAVYPPNDDHKKAISYYRIIFGGDFPAYG